MEKEKFYSVAELAELFNVHVRTIRRWIWEGRLDSYKRYRIMVSQTQLDKFLSAIEITKGIKKENGTELD